MTHGELLKECLILDRVTDAFAIVVMSIAENTINNHWQTRECGRQDALSRFYEKFMRKWKSINPEKNVKAYIASMAYTSLMDEKRRFESDRQKKINYFNNFVINATNIKQQFEFYEALIDQLDARTGHQLKAPEREFFRKETIKLNKKGLSYYVIAKHIGVNRSTVKRWCDSYNSIGRVFYKKDERRKRKR